MSERRKEDDQNKLFFIHEVKKRKKCIICEFVGMNSINIEALQLHQCEINTSFKIFLKESCKDNSVESQIENTELQIVIFSF